MVNEILFSGSNNAKTGKELCAVLGITSRELTQQIERERRAGQPICASCNAQKPGYYLAETAEEMQDYCKRLEHRIKEICITKAHCKRAIDSLKQEGGGSIGTETDKRKRSKR